MGLFRLKKRKLKRDLINYSTMGQKDRARFYSELYSGRTSVNRHKPDHEKFKLNIRIFFF